MASLGGHCPLLALPHHKSLHLHFAPLYPPLDLLQSPSHHYPIATHRIHYFPAQRPPSLRSPHLLLYPLLLLPRPQAIGAPFPSPVLSQAVSQIVPPEALAQSRMLFNRLPLLPGCLWPSL